MNRIFSLNAVLCLPLLAFLWQGSSCRSANANMSNNPSTANDNRSGANQGADLKGGWGGQHIHMEVTTTGAEIEYDCAHGRITEKIAPDANGKFTAKGVHVKERPGPVREGEESEQATTYRGSINDDTMVLTVTLTQNNETVGTFSLTHGKAGRVFKCK